MSDDDYIRTLVTPDMLEDPDEPDIHPLEAMSRRLEADFVGSGLPTYRSEPRPGVEPKFTVNFIPKPGAPRISFELRQVQATLCPACGTFLDADSRCRACWGDVMGLCDECGSILNDGFSCPTHGTRK
jgi:hypothetical protein